MLKSAEKALLERQDEELVKLIQEGSKEAVEALYTRYKGLIYEVSYKYMYEKNVAQMYFDDLIDVAIDSLLIAAREFIVGDDNSFIAYWWVIVERHQTTFLKKTIEKRITYYDPHLIENSCVSSLSDSNLDSGLDIGISIINRIHRNARLFSQDEIDFLERFILGYTPLEIASHLSWNKSKLYRVKKKAMDKLNTIIKSH